MDFQCRCLPQSTWLDFPVPVLVQGSPSSIQTPELRAAWPGSVERIGDNEDAVAAAAEELRDSDGGGVDRKCKTKHSHNTLPNYDVVILVVVTPATPESQS